MSGDPPRCEREKSTPTGHPYGQFSPSATLSSASRVRAPRRTARRVRRLRHQRPRVRCRPPHLFRPLCPAAPRAGVGGHRRIAGRPHHGHARQGPGQPGLRRAEAARAAGRPRRRARPVLDDGRELVGEHAARLARRPARGGARPQRQPGQRGRAPRRAPRPGRDVPLDVGLRDHRRAPLDAPGGADRGRGRRRHDAARGRVLDGGQHRRPRRRVPRSRRPAPALAGHARRPLLRRVRDVRVRHHRRALPARRPARRGRVADAGADPDADGGRGRAPRALRLRAHLLRAARLAARRPGAPGVARPHGRDPRARVAGRRPTS